MSQSIRTNTRHNICNHNIDPPQIQRRMFTDTPPSKHTMLLGRRCTNVIQMFCVCWAVAINRVRPVPVQHHKSK